MNYNPNDAFRNNINQSKNIQKNKNIYQPNIKIFQSPSQQYQNLMYNNNNINFINYNIKINNEKKAFEKEKKKERSIIKKEKQQLENEKLEFKKQMNDERLIIKKENQQLEKEKQQLEKEKSDLEKEKYNIFIKEGLLNEGQNNKININTPKGLLNLGLSCYMNSLLQCLYYIPELRYYFIAKKNSYDDEHPVCKALAEVMYGLRYTENKYFEAREIKNIMGNKNKLFLGVKAADVKDLYFNLIDSILTELEEDNEEETENEENENKIDLTNKLAVFKEAEKENKKDNIINQLLIGYYGTTYTCPKNNNYLTYSFQNESFILFELEKIKNYFHTNKLSIEKCFYYYYRTQEKTSFYCNYCKKVELGNCCEKIYRPPKILVIVLDRGHGKLFKGEIKINQYIDLEICIDEEKYDDTTLYKLICISTHSGSSSPTGHYTARCLTDNDEYYYFSDTQSYKIDEDNLYDDDPYILFYKRINREESTKIHNNTLKNNLIKKIFPNKEKKEEEISTSTKEEKLDEKIDDKKDIEIQGDLEDDFVLLANGGELPVELISEQEKENLEKKKKEEIKQNNDFNISGNNKSYKYITQEEIDYVEKKFLLDDNEENKGGKKKGNFIGKKEFNDAINEILNSKKGKNDKNQIERVMGLKKSILDEEEFEEYELSEEDEELIDTNENKDKEKDKITKNQNIDSKKLKDIISNKKDEKEDKFEEDEEEEEEEEEYKPSIKIEYVSREDEPAPFDKDNKLKKKRKKKD